MTQAAPQIVHESETQRQFIRLQLPAMADIQGKRYSLKDLSSGGVAIRDIGQNLKRGDMLPMDLILPFQDFSLDVSLNAEVQYYDKKLNVAGCRFVNLNAGQVSILSHVVKAYISGDIVGGPDILNVVARDNFVSVRQHKSQQDVSTLDKIRHYITYGVIGLVALGLAAFIFLNVFERAFILTSPNGVVRTESFEISSAAPGVFSMALPEGVMAVEKGQVIGRIETNLTGQAPADSADTAAPALQIKSPCDCFIAETYAANGQYRAQGMPLMRLIPQKGNITITTLVPMQDSHKIKIGSMVVMTVAGTGQEISGTVSDIRASDKPVVPDGMNTSVAASLITIKPDTAISLDHIGRPVLVEFHL